MGADIETKQFNGGYCIEIEIKLAIPATISAVFDCCEDTAKEVVSESKAVEVITQELIDHFKDGYIFHYNVPLNKFMVDWDIKEFVKIYLGVNSWDDLAEDDKGKCYRDYPKQTLPDWNEIAQESY